MKRQFSNYYIYLIICLLAFFGSCSESDTKDDIVDSYDRGAMLENWADNIIIPSYEDYVTDLQNLKAAMEAFSADKTELNLEDVQNAVLESYISWQYVSIFEIGKAESITLRDFSNIYPANVSAIEANIVNGGYNLLLPATRDQQGLPALDYLLFGTGENNIDILDRFASDEPYTDYVSELIERLISLTNEVLDDWKNGYRDSFVMNDGSEASSSVNKLVNDYLFYYEKALRAGKIGIPSGVFSSGTLPDKVEGLYSTNHSKILFDAALDATIAFFNGVHHNSTQKEESLSSYLDYLNGISGVESLSKAINDQFLEARQASANLDASFYQQIMDDNEAMLKTFDELQKNVVLMKVDMLQAMNISVDYVDADGD